MTIEEKAKAYDEAKIRGSQLWESDAITRENYEYIFHEFEESKDKKIKKHLTTLFKEEYGANSNARFAGIKVKDILAWLEKQGKQETLCDKCRKEHPSHSCQDITELGRCTIEHIQSQTDKVEPKFKVGDWITNGATNPAQISSIKNGMYFTHNDTIGGDVESIDKEYHLWTLADAREGDVLAFDNNTMVIFKDLYNKTTFHSYCHIEDGVFSVSEEGVPDWWNGEGFTPATEEQRAILFQKMHEAGYEWDADKKELKIIDWSKHIKYEPNSPSITKEHPTWDDEELAQAKKDAYNDALNKIEYHSGEPTFDDGWSAAIWYLKKRNTTSQTTWKPSEEQMKFLWKYTEQNNYDGSILTSLYNDLKKLKG